MIFFLGSKSGKVAAQQTQNPIESSRKIETLFTDWRKGIFTRWKQHNRRGEGRKEGRKGFCYQIMILFVAKWG